ncbi:hypothetical protein LOTGIDRAFT_153999 [Lottia gigantea]|uniref:HYR domain-containing protein n=1 Tax=Lottia gigantea TaxID=225164 RepID=V3ZX43_LOTGI|nr:hypothetical protein LOTGIDRAFT_153999 [Lottia gigantea]ESO88932.1 hypothetical protein LOTGIDRAFT_153999 [Lottia gigantea]
MPCIIMIGFNIGIFLALVYVAKGEIHHQKKLNLCNSCSADDRNCTRKIKVPCLDFRERRDLGFNHNYNGSLYKKKRRRFTQGKRRKIWLFDGNSHRNMKSDYHLGRYSEQCEKEETYTCRYFKCYEVCCSGWVMEPINNTCSIYDSFPTELHCKNGGEEILTVDGPVCVCPASFTGKNCETNLCDLNCLNEGLCDYVDGAARCVCQKGFKGKLCEKHFCSGGCQNDGRCVIDEGIFAKPFCVCPPKYSGKYCEKSDYEPKPGVCPRVHNQMLVNVGVCTNTCYDDDGCQGQHKCCSTGCGSSCMMPADQFCVWNKTEYTIGEHFKPNACTVCTCYIPDSRRSYGGARCESLPCPTLNCNMIETGECCDVCVDDIFPVKPISYEEPRFVNCPATTLVLVLELDESSVHLPIKLEALDYMTNRLDVFYTRTIFEAGKGPTNFHTVTATSSTDRFGQFAVCIFQIRVKDRQPPAFDYCPSTIKTTKQIVEWNTPIARDNVGLAVKPVSRSKPGEKFKYGDHAIVYKTEDYEGNVANCIFFVKVFPPKILGKRNRPSRLLFSPHNINMFIIGISAFGVVILAIVSITMVWYKSKRSGGEVIPNRLSTIPTGPRASQNIYSVSDAREPPPAYEITPLKKTLMVETDLTASPTSSQIDFIDEASTSRTNLCSPVDSSTRPKISITSHTTNPLYQNMLDKLFYCIDKDNGNCLSSLAVLVLKNHLVERKE